MEHDIREHKFLEYGEHGGNLYGTNLDSIRDVINQGKMCVLDCSPVVRMIYIRIIMFQFTSVYQEEIQISSHPTLIDINVSNLFVF